MQNDKAKFKKEFKKRLYNFALELIKFLDKLPKDNVSKRIGTNYYEVAQVLLEIILKDRQQAARKILLIFSILLLNRPTRANYGLHYFVIANAQNRKKLPGS